MPRLPTALLLVLAASVPSCALVREGRPPGLPRPVSGTDTGAPPDGEMELEAGVTLDPGDSFDAPVTLKAGLGTTEMFVGFSPVSWVERPGDDGLGVGDLTLGARFQLVEGSLDRPWVSIQPALKIPTADPDEDLGSGEVDAALGLAVEQNVLGAALVGFAQFDLLGDPEGSGADVGWVVAGAVTVEFTPGWRAFLELGDIFVPELGEEQVLAVSGVAWQLASGLVLDAGLVVGFTDDAPDLQFVFGLTQPLGRWRR